MFNWMKKKKTGYYIVYTLLYLLFSIAIFRYFFLNDMTFINQTNDGLVQHYKALIYYSEYLREIFRRIFVEHNFVVKRWDFSIGEGADILQTLHMYAIGDPLSFFAVFFPREKIYIWYDLSILIRLYISGIVFSELCFYTGQQNRYALLAGSIIYVFSYWALRNVNEHIYFLNPMIYFPLIIIGVEKIINDDTPYLLTIAVFLSGLSSFYFFYMLVILTVIYTAVRLFNKYGKEIKTILKKVKTIFVFSLTGTLMAAVILFPVISSFINDSRASLDRGNMLLYGRLYYEMLFSTFVSVDNPYDLAMGFASPTLLALGLVIKDKEKKGRLLLTLNIITFVMVCLPFAGKLMNGMAYPINRWSFAIALIVSYTMVYEWNRIEENKKYLAVFMLILFAVAMISAWNRTLRVFVAIILCIGFYFIAVIRIDKEIGELKVKQILLILIVIFNIAYIADCDYSSRGFNRLEDATDKSDAVNEVLNSDARTMKEYVENTGDKGFFRYSGNHLQVNAAMLEGMHSTDFYWSLTNPYVISYREKLGLLDYTSYLYRGFDDRSLLYTLANVKYFMGNDEELIPYGFEKTEDQSVYKNEYYVPFGYTYDKSISYDEWNKLDQIGKEEALLKYIVLDEGNTNAQINQNRINFEIIGDEKTVIEKNQITAKEEKTELIIKINRTNAGEYSLSLSGISFKDTDGYIEGNRNWVRIKTFNGELRKDIYYLPPEYQFYSGRHDFTVCYGYLENGIDEIKLVLPYPGIYHFDDLYVSCAEYDDYRQDTDNLKEDVLKNLVFEDNYVSGNIDLNDDKYLLLSIPYSRGWKAYVNGEKTELLRANECYMALKLNKGNNTVELKYCTPYLKAGTAVSIVSVVVFVCLIMKRRKSK